MPPVDVSDQVAREFAAEFGEDAPLAAERALRGEITRHRIERAVSEGTDPANAVAEVLSTDPQFLAEVEGIAEAGEQPPGDLTERLRRATN